MNQNLEENVRQILSRWTEGLCPGGQVLIRKGGETFYEGCFGYGNLENRIPITPESIFHIASISKQFTVLSVLLLQEDGLLSVDDDIRRYVGDLIRFEEPVTLRQMFNNVSGIRDQWELLFMRGIKINDSIDMEDVNETIRLQKSLNFPPQEGYLYSNTGFHLLSVIVERLSGMSFPQFVRERIFKPLHMDSTLVRGSYNQIIPGLAYSYQDDGTGTYYYNPLNYSLYGPTSVNTCARDLIKILDEYRNPSLFSPETVKTVLTAAVLKDGSEIEYCGGMMTHVWNGLKVYEHGGADAAYRAQLLWIPEKELEVVLLSNTTTYMASVAAKKLAAQSLGIAQCCLEESIRYAKERKQFGRPIAKFQAISFMIADMATEIEAAREMIYSTALAKDAGEKDAPMKCSMCKLFASEMANRVAYKAVQIHGGYGYMRDYKVERMYRDARITTIYEGTSQVQQMVIAGNLLK